MEPKHPNQDRLVVGSIWWFQNHRTSKPKSADVYPIVELTHTHVTVSTPSGGKHREAINSFLSRFIPGFKTYPAEVFQLIALNNVFTAINLRNEFDSILVEEAI